MTHSYIYKHTRMHAYIHTYMHTYIHTYIHIYLCFSPNYPHHCFCLPTKRQNKATPRICVAFPKKRCLPLHDSPKFGRGGLPVHGAHFFGVLPICDTVTQMSCISNYNCICHNACWHESHILKHGYAHRPTHITSRAYIQHTHIHTHTHTHIHYHSHALTQAHTTMHPNHIRHTHGIPTLHDTQLQHTHWVSHT